MRVKDIKHLAKSKKGNKKRVFNPTTKDFTWKWHGKGITVPNGESVELDVYAAEHITKHLIDHILTKKGINTDNKKGRKAWQKKVLI